MSKRLFQKILKILSAFYGCAVTMRNALYDAGIFQSYSVPVPVLCVGNITAGGNAKTPLARYLVSLLRSQGLKPVILSRGYGGSTRGPHRVTLADSAQLVGDEPLMLAEVTGVPVVIARDRVRGATYIVEHALGDVIVLDDGFQHRRLARNLDIIAANMSSDHAVSDFIEGTLLPAGRFREPRLPALQRAHMLIFADRRIVQEPLQLPDRLFASLPQQLQLFRAHLKSAGLRPVSGTAELALGTPVVVMTAIANPDGFIESVAGIGFPVEHARTFADHYAFNQQDVDSIVRAFPDMPIVCTEKDYVKLRALKLPATYVLATELVVVPTDAFRVQVMKGLRQAERGKVRSLQAADPATKKVAG